MNSYFDRVKSYAIELGLKIVAEEPAEGLLIVDDESRGVKNLMLDCENPILVIEQLLFKLPEKVKKDPDILLRLLQMNRNLIHGAYVIDDSGAGLLYRDTLQLKNLDFNELEGSINALSLGLAEHGGELLEFLK